jgi:hypothetical protein
MKRSAVCLGLCVAAVLGVAPASAKTTFFASPTGNIGCVINGKGARCDIQDHRWPTPPKPSWCDVDYGGGVQVGRHEAGSFVCAGDTVFTPDAEELAYGQRIERGRFRCASKERDKETVRCVNRRNGQGFRLSKKRVKLF